jgi:signal transduction histidine kinase/ligand-binding sensor domain-containing protein
MVKADKSSSKDFFIENVFCEFLHKMQLMPNCKNVILVVRDRKKLAFLLVLLVSAFISGAQHRLLFQSIGVNEGLSHSSVYSLLQDSRGFIWAGTADGLNRYDGREVKVYRPDDALQNAEAAFIRDKPMEDKNGNIWYVSLPGIYCWEKKTDHVVRKKKLNNNAIAFFFVTQNGDMWLLDVIEGVFSYNIYTGETKKYPYSPSLDPSKFASVRTATDHKNKLWFALHGNGDYYAFDIRDKQYKKSQYKSKVALMAYEDGRLWLSDNKSMDIYTADNGVLLSSVRWNGPELIKSKLLKDKAGHFWLSMHGYGVACLDESGRMTHLHSHDSYSNNTLSSDNVTEIIQDRGEVLWLASDGGGLMRTSLKKGAFSKFPVDERDHPEIKDFSMTALYEQEDGNILFSGRGCGLCVYAPKDNSIWPVSFFPKKEEFYVLSFYKDTDDVLWLGTSAGIGYVKNGKWVYNRLSQIEQDNVKVFHILNKGKDTLLLATSHSIKVMARKGDVWKEHTLAIPGKLRTRLTSVADAGNGYYWMASPTEGLLKAKWESDHFSVVDSPLNKETIRVIHRDEIEPDVLWLGSKRGLWRYDARTGKKELYNTGNGLANAFIYSVLEDEYHNLWMSTNGGLTCYNRQSKAFSNYTYKSGLQSNEFNSEAFHKGKSGILYFGGIKGFNWLTGKSVFKDTLRPQVIVTGMIAGDSIVNPYTHSDRIDIAYGNNSLNIQAAVADYTKPEANYVRYKLEGWDRDWNISATGEVRYTNLQPGNYTLYIYGVGSNQAISKPRVFYITIVAPFWQQGWFKMLFTVVCIGIITLLIYAWYKRKVSKTMRELEQEKMLAAERNRISRDLHDDIGGAITKISLLSELIPLQHKGAEKILADVKIISTTARDVSQSMSDIVWALHTQHDSLEGLLSYLREKIREFLEPISVKYRLDFPDDDGNMKLSGEQRRNILLVMKEALNNAVKYADASLITISCRRIKGRLVFKVVDDGKGFDILNAEGHGNGLKNMHKRMESIKGDFVILQPGKGTEIIFSVPG